MTIKLLHNEKEIRNNFIIFLLYDQIKSALLVVFKNLSLIFRPREFRFV